MTIIGSLAVSLRANTKKYKRGMKQAESITQRFGRTVARVGKGLAVGMTAALAAVAVGTTIAVKRQFQLIDATAKVSDKLGIATEKLIGLRLAAELSGNTVRNLELGLQRMTRRVSEAAQGTGEAQAAIKELGLDAKALNKLSPDEQFLSIADAMEKVESQGDRVRLGFKLFDAEGVALINTLRGGSDALRKTQQEAERLGLTFSRFEASRIEMANDAMRRLRLLSTGVTQALAIQLAPFVTVVANRLIDMGTQGELASTRIIDGLEVVALGFAKVGDSLSDLIFGYKRLTLISGTFDKLLKSDNATQTAKILTRFNEAMEDLISGDTSTRKLKLFFAELRRDAARAGLGISGGIGAIPGIPEIGGVGGRRSLGAREIRSLRSINPTGNNALAPLKGIEQNTKTSSVQARRQTLLLEEIIGIFGRVPSPQGI